jgi:FYVE/RhoGEF/PH domain-containing protein 5/6
METRSFCSVNSAPPSTVDFPSVGESSQLHPPSAFQQRPQYLPFRRISLPTAPSMIKRNSVASMQSYESVPEDAQPAPMMPLVMRNVSKKSGARPPPAENERRKSHQRLRPINEAHEAKRRKIIHEFWETERSYVDGLELIYSVS